MYEMPCGPHNVKLQKICDIAVLGVIHGTYAIGEIQTEWEQNTQQELKTSGAAGIKPRGAICHSGSY